MNNINENKIENIVQSILADYDDDRIVNKTDIYNQPDKAAIVEIVQKLLKLAYPGYYADRMYKLYSIKNNMAAAIEDVMYHLNKQITTVFRYTYANTDMTFEEITNKASEITLEFMSRIPSIREFLNTDVEAAFDGDPAASGYDEIILSYPGLYAITVYRMAHELFLLGVPMIPRIMTEYAHDKTGVDIHPGAKIGKYFFIDHGTGIVIGETTVIGEHVKIYQGVTLGGLSTKGGQALKGVKRHPTIMDNVTIYSGASILGGETIIGEGVVVGGNAFVTSSIEKGGRATIEK